MCWLLTAILRDNHLFFQLGLLCELATEKQFRALALFRSESRNCGLCAVYMQKDGATLLVGVLQSEKQQNQLVE